MLPSKYPGLNRDHSLYITHSITKPLHLIQACKSWLLHYVASSTNRVGGLAKYLVVLAGSFETAQGTRSKPSPQRRRLHILYLLNDILHHTKYHLDSPATFSTFCGSLQQHVVELLAHAAAYDQEKYPRHYRRLHSLLDIWSENGYFGDHLLHRLRETVNTSTKVETEALDNGSNADTTKKPPGKDVPYVMPSIHGDMSTPYYDLPAGNWIPHIIPNSTIPLRPSSIKPLQFMAGPADEGLIKAVKGLLDDFDQIYGTEQLVKGDSNIDVDELGQRILRDEASGDILDGETYYGWSRAFCQQMKKKPDGSHSRSRSDSRGRYGHKRRYSDDSFSDVSRRPESRSRSRSRPSKRGNYRNTSRSRSRSYSQHRPYSRESSYSPKEPSPPRFPPQHHSHQPPHPPSHPPPQYAPPHPSYQTPSYPHHHIPPSSHPPPPPPQYSGPWPPAPPPGLPFVPGGPGMNNPAFPPSFSGQPQMPGPNQPLPPGQFHFPPPHSGNHGHSWGPSNNGRNWR